MISVDELVKELEAVYEEQCYRNPNNKIKCLALDEQAIALIYLILEEMNVEDGFDKDDYMYNNLFIVRKKSKLNKNACGEKKLSNEILKYKKFLHTQDYLIDNMKEVKLTFYALIILEATIRNTYEKKEFERSYLKIYAYFACLYPKIFVVLFTNQIYSFMKKVHEAELDVKRVYIEAEEMRFEEYVKLMSNEGRLKVTENIIEQFGIAMGYDVSGTFEQIKPFERVIEQGFLAFDYNKMDTIRDTRFVQSLIVIEYFQNYLTYLKADIGRDSDTRIKIYQSINRIEENTKVLKTIFLKLLEEEKGEAPQLRRKYDNISGLLKYFVNFCKEEEIKLIDI